MLGRSEKGIHAPTPRDGLRSGRIAAAGRGRREQRSRPLDYGWRRSWHFRVLTFQQAPGLDSGGQRRIREAPQQPQTPRRVHLPLQPSTRGVPAGCCSTDTRQAAQSDPRTYRSLVAETAASTRCATPPRPTSESPRQAWLPTNVSKLRARTNRTDHEVGASSRTCRVSPPTTIRASA